ncbi:MULTISPECIES: KGK domain-containing protein [Trichocoleus]|uniref:KGK family protein n=1 Tax=Trichocoleus desertorum GB2-A4 TaxID=2933944 RepID=A0ABV0J970_9CYAN|nr:KGK domain-containing protein [Trichocoleus sp. FACHB-46]MBD1861183.1 hypothetical protein [Trichocoleus sp. FACHB-46]
MENQDFLSEFGNEDVIAFGSVLHKTGKFKNVVKNTFMDRNWVPIKFNTNLGVSSEKWLEEGVSCEILRLGDKSWQKGKIKIRVSVEFCPDEPEITESPLDDIRQAIAEH